MVRLKKVQEPENLKVGILIALLQSVHTFSWDRQLTFLFLTFVVSLKKRSCPMSPCNLPSTLGIASLPAVHPAPHLRTPQVT